MQNHDRETRETCLQGGFETSKYPLYAGPLLSDLSWFQYLLHCFSPARNRSPELEHCTNGCLLYGSERAFDNRTKYCASQGFKKVFGCNSYNLRKPDARYELFTSHPWKPFPDLPCNRIFRTWRRAYVAFLSLPFIKNCRRSTRVRCRDLPAVSGALPVSQDSSLVVFYMKCLQEPLF